MEAYLGQLKLFAGTFAPQGWLLCNGQLLDISANDALFNLLGTTYGGDGISTFALPDLRGRVPMGPGTDQAGNNVALGTNGGAETVTLTGDNLPPHTHSFVTSTQKGNSNPRAARGNLLAAQPDGTNLFRATNPTVNAGAMIQSSAGGPHENRQPYIVINYIICTEGIYPPQS
jgi:microcystin-dependent protein